MSTFTDKVLKKRKYNDDGKQGPAEDPLHIMLTNILKKWFGKARKRCKVIITKQMINSYMNVELARLNPAHLYKT